jgi:hypothetical protein
MTPQTIPRGSFSLARHFHRNEWLRGGGVALLMLAFGGFCVVYGACVARDLLEVGRIWKQGHDSPVEAAYGGRVTTHNFILKSYELDITFIAEEREEPLTFQAEFHRFFTGPDEGDSMTVRYLENEPEKAVSSWQHDGLAHGWAWFGLVWLFGAFGLVVAVMMVRATIALTSSVDALLREGQLLLAKVEQAKPGGAANNPVLVVQFKTPRCDASQKQTFFLKRGAPLFVGEQQVVVLASIDQKQAHALREDGYPLSELPDLTKLGVDALASAEPAPDNDNGADDSDDDAQARAG